MFKKRDNVQVEIYSDADWAGSICDRRSTSRCCTFVERNLITWRNKKQNVITRSSAKAEFRSLTHGICEVMWIKRLLEDLKIPVTSYENYCDNKAAISIAHNLVQHDRTKHIEVDRYFVKEKLESGLICVPYMPNTE